MRKMISEERKMLLKRNITDLRRSGIWISNDEESFREAFYKIILFSYGVVFPLFGSFADAARQLWGLRDTIDDLLQAINQSLSYCLLLGVLTGFITKRKQIAKQLERLPDVGINQRPSDSNQTDKKTELFTKIAYTTIAFAFFMYSAIPFIFWNACQEKKQKAVYLNYMPCGFFTTLWYPFNFGEFPVYPIVLVSVNVLGMYYSLTVTSTILLESSIIFHIISHIRNLKSKLQVLNEFHRQEDISECVQYHQAIISFCTELSDNFSFISASILLTGTVIISIVACLLLLSDSTADNLRMGFYLIPTITLFFFLNLTGELLSNESVSLADTIYELDWVDFPVSMQKDIRFMILRCQLPLQLSAGPINKLSLEMFSAIMSSAYSYITLLTNLK